MSDVYVRVSDKPVKYTREAFGDTPLAVDFDSDGEVVGVEVLGAASIESDGREVSTQRELVRDLIGAFVVMEHVRKATGDPAVRGVRECIQHLQDLDAAMDAGDESPTGSSCPRCGGDHSWCQRASDNEYGTLLPADQFDTLAEHLDEPDDAPALAELGRRPRRFKRIPDAPKRGLDSPPFVDPNPNGHAPEDFDG